jgi:hypothetical protein
LAILLCVAAPAASQESDWRLASERFPIGGEVVVVLTSGAVREAVLRSVDAAGIPVGSDGGLLRYELQEIAEVRRRGDSVWNGALVGLAAGAGLGLLGYAHPCSGRSCYREEFLGAFTAIGVGIGTMMDVLHEGTTTIYRSGGRVAVLPYAGPRRWGMAIQYTK